MTEQQARQFILEAFQSANITTFKADTPIQDVILGNIDMELSAFDIDSLATMELCISLEINTGASISPAELVKIKTIHNLAMTIIKKHHA